MATIKSQPESDQKLWSIVKMKLYEGDKPYDIKDNLSKVIKTIKSEIYFVNFFYFSGLC